MISSGRLKPAQVVDRSQGSLVGVWIGTSSKTITNWMGYVEKIVRTANIEVGGHFAQTRPARTRPNPPGPAPTPAKPHV